MVDRLRLGVGVKITKKNNGSIGRRRKADITGILAGLDVSTATSIRQISVDKKIICPNCNNISETLNGISWLTVRWFSDGVAVFEKKGKLAICIRMVIGRVVFLKFKRKNLKK